MSGDAGLPVYSAERDAIIRRDWPAGVPLGIILRQMAELPGPMPVGRKSVKSRAYRLGVKRPDGWFMSHATADYAPWPAERRDLAIALYRDASLSSDAIVDRLNRDFPTLRAITWKGVQQKMRKCDVRREWVRHKPAGRPPRRHIAMDQPPQPAPLAHADKIERAARMVAGKGRNFHIWSVVAHTGLEAWQVCMVAGRIAMGLPLR